MKKTILAIALLICAKFVSGDEPINVNTKNHLVSTPSIIDFSAVTVLGLPFNQYFFGDSIISNDGTVTLVNDTSIPGNLQYYGTDGNGTLGYHSLCSGLSFADSIINTGGIVTLVGDTATPAASQYYGTNGSSVLGFYDLPSGGGAVNSVFGRSGDVVATTGDYTAAQVTNAVDSTSTYSDPAWITALIWSKITSTPTTLAGYGITDAVPNTRTVNGHALSSNVTVTPTDLSLVIGTNVQAWDADLDTWATKTPYAGTVVVTTGKTFTDTNNLTLSGTDGSTLNIGAGGTLGSNAFNSTTFLTGNQTITLSGDVTGSGATAITTSYNNAVPTAKGGVPSGGSAQYNILQKNSATNYDDGWQTLSTILDGQIGTDQGSIIFRGATTWTSLPPSTDGDVLTTHGASADPTWEVSSAGSIASTTAVLAGNGTGSAVASGVTNTATVQTIELGNVSDTTLTRASAGVMAVEGANVLLNGGALGTPSSGTLTNCTFPTLNQNTTGSAATLTTARNLWGQSFDGSAAVGGAIELGTVGTTDTTFTRSSAGHASIEGSVIGLASDNLGFFSHSTSASIGVGSIDMGTAPVALTVNSGTGRLLVAGGTVPVSTDTLGFFTASTSTTIGVGNIELGHATDTTISRLGAGSIEVEGVAVPTISSTSTLTNKDLTSGTNTFPTFNQNTTGSSAKWTTARNLGGNSVDGSANVSFANKFIVQGTSDSGLSAAQFLGALGTGIVKNTTTTGVLSIATSSDVVALFSSCSGTQYLGADGACHTAGGGGTIATTTNVLKGDNAGNAISTGLAAPTGAFVGTTDTQALTNKDLTGSGNTFPPDKGKVHYVGYNWTGFGTALVAADMVGVITVPYAGTITGYAISVDTGTCTVKTYKKATGTAIPTSSDNISTSGVAISTGTHLKSATTSDFTTTTVTAYDQFLFTLSAVSSATFVTFQLEITE